MKTISRFCLLFLLLSGSLITSLRAASELTLANLRCEYLGSPEGIDVLQPRLSWELQSDGRNQRQTAYQILAASSPDLLEEGRADLWSSGKVSSDETAHIRYAGAPLKSAQPVFWKVRVYDQADVASAWSPVARWTMGLLQESDWRAKWIGLDGKIVPNHLKDTRWIGFPADSAPSAAATGSRYYRRVIQLPAGREVKRARFLYTGDRSANGWINGREMGERDDHHRIKDQDLTFRMSPGPNVVALTGTAPGKTVAAGGVVAAIEIEFMQGEPMRIVTDESWKVSDVETPGWNENDFDDSRWLAAKNLGPVGMEPWGYVRIAEDRRQPARTLRKEFDVAKKIRRATVFYSGLGWSELYLNGRKVGDHALSPGLTEYTKRSFYVTHEVTDLLRAGRNAIGTVLGNGRYFGPRSVVYASMPTFGFPKLRLHLRIEHDDHSVSEVVSDESWKLTTDGPIAANNDFDGEEYDARRELGAWSTAGYDDSKWRPAEIVGAPSEKIVAQMIDPIRVTGALKPVAITEPKPGIFIFDLGQNMVGWVRLKVVGPAGTVVMLRHAETLLPDGTPALANLRGVQATNVYTLKGGGPETWEPCFSTQGFRYVEVRGFPGKPGLDAIEGLVVNDDLRVTGEFASSNPLLDQIHRNVSWGVRGNNKSIPMDCPQRDERQGWLGDRLEESRGEAYLFDNAAFYAKWLQDIRDSQKDNGSLPDVAPAHWPSYTDNVTWPSSAIIIPNMLLEHYADREVIARNYDAAKKWMDHMSQFVTDGIIARDKWTDWCVPPEDPILIHTKDPARITRDAVLATTFFYHDARLMERFATMLGKPGDAAHFNALAETLKKAFNEKFYNRELGQYDNGTQTSSVLPLAFGMVPEDQRARVFGHLVKNINEVTRGHIGTGLVGGQYLYRVLSDNGRADLAYTIATQTDYPGFGYMVSKGATTLWELWNGDTADPWMNSGNHVMLAGDFVVWLYECLGGIKSDAAVPGFKHVVMKPHPVGDLKFVRASYGSLRGRITSHWSREQGNFDWRLSIPPNTTATVFVPAVSAARVTEGGKPAAKAEGVTFLREENGHAVFRIGSGAYHFAAP
ncbi:MAG TPA: family 78 glycoside hydrolase catalytic domain [Opitutaceae bacterium]|nr:family 78 glycoside hydrolase catalytic domain [Opitutaceae bacterium]